MKAFVIDVDGCLTDGTMIYSGEGKEYKTFGADDHDALNMIKDLIDIQFVTADVAGYYISYRRIVIDMGFPLALVSMEKRVAWIKSQWDLSEVIYMGDGILDPPIFKKVGYAICPNDGFYLAKEKANYVTSYNGGHRAVAEACVHIKKRFFPERDDNYYNV